MDDSDTYRRGAQPHLDLVAGGHALRPPGARCSALSGNENRPPIDATVLRSRSR